MTSISLRHFLRSLRHAWHGFKRALATENSFRIHIAFVVMVTVLIGLLDFTRTEIAILVMLMSTILILELVNTMMERFVGLLEPRIHSYVGEIKDLMAAAVLIVSVGAVFIAFLLIWPKIAVLIR